MADEMDQQERQSLYFKPAEIILVELMKSTKNNMALLPYVNLFNRLVQQMFMY
jgi:hypothetical protein